MDTRTCSKCKENKRLDQFWRGQNNSWCAACQKTYRRARPEKYSSHTRERKIAIAGYRKTPKGRLTNVLIAARCRSKKDRIPFNITRADIAIPEFCPVLGIKMDGSDREHCPSIERIRPEAGYTKGNVIVISMRANRIKSDASLEGLSQIVRFYNELSFAPPSSIGQTIKQ